LDYFWGFFFIAAMALQIHGRALQLNRSLHELEIDTITGILPTSCSTGASRKVVLEIPSPACRYVIWKIVWALSSIVNTTSVIATYLALGQSPTLEVFFVWTTFQFAWLVLRSRFFQIAEDKDRPFQVNLQGKPWTKVSAKEKLRVRRLVFALSKYQGHIHPRGLWSYNEDLEMVDGFENVFNEYPIDVSRTVEVQISVHAVIGDTLLSSVAWILGSKKGAFDFYDTCIVILNLKGSTIAIPAARVLSGLRPRPLTDPELGNDLVRPPRGSSNMGIDIEWCFWIPCGGDRWLYFSSEKMKFKGQRNESCT
jgi:hypothetical protein